ncbi:MAG: type transport system ATP-binding protein, partial [Frankiaceae bacterium]|nr:type transport system ATP-binding protein [Frankiaceae bacterium]
MHPGEYMARHDRRRRTTTALSLFTAAAAAVAWTGLGGAAGAAPTSAAAAPPYPASAPGPLATTCATYEGGQEICSGTLPSFDGAPLDFDVTRPTNNSPGPHPLIVMLHGFGNDKHEWESVNDTGDNGDKYHWNSHWFAEHGYYVLTYTARGFGAETSPAAYNPPTPSSPPDPACGGTPPKGGSDCPTRT